MRILMLKLCSAIVAAVVCLPTEEARGQSCQLYAAALTAVGATVGNTVVADETQITMPQFAFYAMTTFRRGDTVLAREMIPKVVELTPAKVSLQNCLADSLGWTLRPDSMIRKVFAKEGGGWEGFSKAFPGKANFAYTTRPVISANGDTAVLIVSIASGNLAGHGTMYRFVRNAEKAWIKVSEVQLFVS